MSEARSPRESCSTTIGTSGLTPAPCGRGVTPSQCGSARRPRRWSALWSGNGPSRSVYVGRCVPHAGRATRAAAPPRFPPNGDRRQGESCLRASRPAGVRGCIARLAGGSARGPVGTTHHFSLRAEAPALDQSWRRISVCCFRGWVAHHIGKCPTKTSHIEDGRYGLSWFRHSATRRTHERPSERMSWESRRGTRAELFIAAEGRFRSNLR
jgi:hypothetical protein